MTKAACDVAAYDVVIVGGGYAGSSLAAALARDGYEVCLLERQTTYRDKVRGEVINCWGVVELKRLGLECKLLDAGGSYANRFVGYDETIDPAEAEAGPLKLDEMLPGIPGVLDVGHPEACEALNSAAAEAGATVVRGSGDVCVEPGRRQTVRYEFNDVEHEISCRLVVGADGRQSAVRRQLGIPLTQTPPNSLGGGLLVDNADHWPVDRTAIGTERDVMYFVFPRRGGFARLYILHDKSERGRFSGPGRFDEFMTAFQLRCLPEGILATARPASPTCAFYGMNDAWTETPAVRGGVLVGDAAGWSDPVVGQGTAVALRDARSVWEILRSTDDWSPEAFEPYAVERRERMRRLLLSGQVRTAINITFTPEAARRRRAYRRVLRDDPVLAGTRLCIYKGPEGVPDESFAPETIDRILALR